MIHDLASIVIPARLFGRHDFEAFQDQRFFAYKHPPPIFGAPDKSSFLELSLRL